MAVDKPYCMSSFLAYRYVYDRNKEFVEGIKHRTYALHSNDKKTLVSSAKDIDLALRNYFNSLKEKKFGIMLSGGMDSAILASYIPEGSNAYTFRFLGGKYGQDDLRRAELYAKHYKLNLHYVDIDWSIVEKNLIPLMKQKGAPVHSIEPQIMEAALQAKKDGVELMVIGDAADYVFYGMDGLLAKDWLYEDFYKRIIYINPFDVLVNPVDMHCIIEKYRHGEKVDYLGIYDSIVTEESYASYDHAFLTVSMPYVDPYEIFLMAEPVDLGRIRNGQSKYLIRDLFKMKYPNISIPDKTPMPRPVDEYFKTWNGPTRNEFRNDIDVSSLTGNQKWLLYSLERFLLFVDNDY